jgi:hypothetical protein
MVPLSSGEAWRFEQGKEEAPKWTEPKTPLWAG